MISSVGRIINNVLRPLGFELHRRSAWDRARRATYEGGLEHLKQKGFAPKTVIDVGVARGTLSLYESFPDTRHILIDPLEESKPFMAYIGRKYPHVESISAAAAQRNGNVEVNVHPQMERSSIYWESDYKTEDVSRRTVPAVTLDLIQHERNLRGPFLLKIDVQGAEIDVLEGAKEVLKATECVLLETSLFEFFKGAPLIKDVVNYMNNTGFSIYDVWALQYRPHDNALTMIDIAFVKTAGQFRTLHRFHPKNDTLQ